MARGVFHDPKTAPMPPQSCSRASSGKSPGTAFEAITTWPPSQPCPATSIVVPLKPVGSVVVASISQSMMASTDSRSMNL